MKQVSDFWRKEDGQRDVFEEFVRTNFAGDQSTLDQLFNRFQHNLEQFDGHMVEIGREFRQQSDLDTGHMIAFQIEEQVDKAGNLGAEFERMATVGSVVPDVWMKKATGAPVGPEALLHATEKALREVR